MKHYAGLDVSVKETSICIVDEAGRICREMKVVSHPEDLLAVLCDPAWRLERVGLEAGPLSQWLFSGLAEAGVPAICIETRHAKAFLKAQVNKLSSCPDVQWDQEWKDEIPDHKTEPAVCALLRAISNGDLCDKFDPIAAQPFVTAECGLVVLFHLMAGGYNERIFDRHRVSLPSKVADCVGSSRLCGWRSFGGLSACYVRVASHRASKLSLIWARTSSGAVVSSCRHSVWPVLH